MNQEHSELHESVDSDVIGLLEQRAQIEQWLERLEDQRGSVSTKIIERVREDYQRRLRETLEGLAGHREVVQRELESAETRLEEAERGLVTAAEQLEEGQLRSAIGELDPTSWSAERAELEAARDRTARAEADARDEVARLREILDQLEDRDSPAAPSAESPPPVEPLSSAHSPTAAPIEPIDVPSVRSDDVNPERSEGFLRDIDRALSDPDDTVEAGLPPVIVDEEGLEDTAPKPGIKCGECGYTNDLSAWFCGVCGADVG